MKNAKKIFKEENNKKISKEYIPKNSLFSVNPKNLKKVENIFKEENKYIATTPKKRKTLKNLKNSLFSVKEEYMEKAEKLLNEDNIANLSLINSKKDNLSICEKKKFWNQF